MTSTTPFIRACACALAALALLPCVAWAQAGEPGCGALDNAYGPFDYRTQQDKLAIVNKFHFTPEIEALTRGNTGTLGGDLDYTLRASPNHHRALIALLRLSEHTTLPQPAGLPRPIECYFDRALRFQRDDPIPRMIYARYLAIHKREKEASQQLEVTAGIADGNPMTHYNIGLIYLELKDYPHALEQAYQARSLGLAANGLQNQLKAAGQWREPAAAASTPTASAPEK